MPAGTGCWSRGCAGTPQLGEHRRSHLSLVPAYGITAETLQPALGASPTAEGQEITELQRSASTVIAGCKKIYLLRPTLPRAALPRTARPPVRRGGRAAAPAGLCLPLAGPAGAAAVPRLPGRAGRQGERRSGRIPALPC